MADHAGERYLRLLVEHILVNGGRAEEGPATVEQAGAALAAVGAVDAGTVTQLRDDLSLGLALRRPSPDPARLAAVLTPRPPPAAAETAAVTPRAVAAGPNRFETPEGVLVVESVSFGTDGATVVETLETDHGLADQGPADQGPRRRSRRGATWPVTFPDPVRSLPSPRHRWRAETGIGEHRPSGSGPRTSSPGVPPRARPVAPGREQLRITDDRGQEYVRSATTVGAGPVGWRWVSTLQPVPGPTTTRIQVALGESAPYWLAVNPGGGVARGRPHGRGAGVAWLLGALQHVVAQSLRDRTPPRTGAVAEGVQALLALGWLRPSEPLLRQLALLATYPDGAAELDPGLGSPLAGRERRPGDRLAVLALAYAVDLDVRTARLDVATLDGDGFRLTGCFSPWSTERGSDQTSGWHITGFDDHHNYYVATVEQHQPAAAGSDVVWRLWPPLDPSARSLRLRVAGPTLEASVEVVVE